VNGASASPYLPTPGTQPRDYYEAAARSPWTPTPSHPMRRLVAINAPMDPSKSDRGRVNESPSSPNIPLHRARVCGRQLPRGSTNLGDS
jgi:hypothetical protein